MKAALVLLACLGLCACAVAPEWDDALDQQQSVAPIVGHQQYVTPLPEGAAFQNSMWDLHKYYGGGASSQIPQMFARPQPPFSY